MQMAAQRPFWSPAYLPFGKGAAFLRKHLSATPRELAITQLKAIKLLVWANLLFALRDALVQVFEQGAGIPDPHAAIDALLAGHPYPIATGWAALTLATAKYALQIAAWADLFIGIARLAGYRLPRGSWRPLEAKSLMDYFNRFHYYFKELLVDLFFMPSFFRLFRQHPRLRMFFATFMAAGVGNALWHFSRNILEVAIAGPASAFVSYTSYVFYAVVLAGGVGLSQLRANRGVPAPTTAAARVGTFAFVWSFVICIHVFGDGNRVHTLAQRLKFMASLFGASA
jgi:D-alanyl-lipoteichoic acid acyltransferase DltB (MBOAT superfamily)